MGTGMRYFARTCPVDGTFRGSALLTHLHWDHTQGLPFFAPLICGAGELDVYAPRQEDGVTVADVFETMIRPPLFPVSLAGLPGTVRFHDTAESDFTIGEIAVKAREVPHIGTTLGYRVEWGGRSIAYISDHQQPSDGSFSATPGALELAEGADLLIHDSQYTAGEFAMKSTWGHCTVDYALWLATTARVKRLALFHHDPGRDDRELHEIARSAKEHGRRNGYEVVAATEGLSLCIPA